MVRRLPHGQHLLALVVLLLAALVLPACGGEDETATPSAGGPDPATVVPADAFLYGEVLVRPEGDVEEGARAALRKALGVADPGADLRRLVDRALAEDGDDSSYERDFEPWLGERAGGFVRLPADPSDDEADFAFAFAIADREALEQTIERFRARDDQHPAGAYRGVEYDQEADDEAVYSAIVDELYVGGSLGGVRAAIDASKGERLAETPRFEDAIAEVGEDALASLYFDPRALARQLRTADGVDPQIQQAFRSPRLAEADPVIASLTADEDRIAIEASVGAELAGDDAAEDEAAVTLGELPGDAWLALATPPIGPSVREALDGAGIRKEAARQLRQETGLDLDRDLLDEIGGLGLFVRGTSPLAIGGGILLRTTSDAGARRLVTLLQSIVAGGGVGETRPIQVGGGRGFQLSIPQSPQPIVVLAKGDEIAAGYAASSAQDLLDPTQRLEDDSTAQAAIDSLGEGFVPSFVLLVPPVADLLRALDQLQVADFSQALPYVSAYRSLAVGTQQDDDRTTVRVVATLR